MIPIIKRVLKSCISSQFRVFLKKQSRHLKQMCERDNKLSLADFKSILINECGLKKGDKIIVSSSFGNLNATFSPKEAILTLQEIVTKEGLIMMPYYPPMNSTEWADKNEIFDMVNTKSGMGILTNVFSKMEGVMKSIHPTKAVCAWGNLKGGGGYCIDTQQHRYSTTPFYWDSPYGELLKTESKSLCLGLKNIPIFHAFEDLLSQNYYDYYYPEKKRLKVRLEDGSMIEVSTYVHNPAILDKCMAAGDYVRSLGVKSYKRVKCGLSYITVVQNLDLFERVRQEFEKGNSRLRF